MSLNSSPDLRPATLQTPMGDSLSHGRRGLSVSLAESASGFAGIAATLAVLGLCSISSSVLALWALWTTDALKSIGMLVPVVSFLLVLRAWRALGWELDGSWFGFLLLVATAILVRVRDQAVLVLLLSPQWSVYFPPHSLVLFLYGIGVTLLCGGPRLIRASIFPLCLLLLANPVPHIFNVYVDLPLQSASAHVARAFAHALGQPLTPDKLRLMFTPNFGMFIAPGCNGIRGAVTMGFVALIAGYLYRFRWHAHAAVVAGGILLGYLFNFVRLCSLVVFYVLALHANSLQNKEERIDYAIGGALFFVGVLLLYAVIQRLGRSSAATRPEVDRLQQPDAIAVGAYSRLAAMAVFTVASCALFAHAANLTASAAVLASDRQMGQFPATLGSYTLVRTWNENLSPGTLLFHWAEYAAADGTPHVAIGISPVLGAHDTLICHSARGEDPVWHGQQTLLTAAQPVAFSTALFNNGTAQSLEVTTLCNNASCGEYATANTHLGFVWSKPRADSVLSQDRTRPIPILIKTETTDTTLSVLAARQQLSTQVASFLANADLDTLTLPYRRP